MRHLPLRSLPLGAGLVALGFGPSAAKVAAASAEGEVKGLRLALERAERLFWKRWWS